MTPTAVIGDYAAALTIDGTTHYLLIQPGNSSTAYRKINRNVLLGVTGQPMDVSTAQSVTNKTLDNSNILTLRDDRFTLQDNVDTTKQAQFQLSGITTATTRTYTLPNASSTLADISTVQTLTNKTLTSPTISGGSIDNATVTVDSIAGHTTSNSGTIYGISVSSGVISSPNTVNGTALTNSSVTASKLSTGALSATVATSETTTSTTYADLATTTDTVTVTVGANGLALVIITSDLYNSNSGQFCQVSFAVSGSNTIAAADSNALTNKNAQNADEKAMSWSKLFTGLNPGSTTFKMKYRVNANTGTFSNRTISVIPL